MESKEHGHVFSVDGHVLEFVLNNGRDKWDHPFPINDRDQNYIIKGNGHYYLKHGTITPSEELNE